MEKPVRAPVVHAVRNVLRGQIKSAQAALRNAKSIDDRIVHSARKDLKRARAGLRLLRETIGERRFTIENARLRDAARPLSRVRDAKVLLDTAGKLIADEKKVRDREALRKLAASLRRERKVLRAQRAGP